MIGNILSKIIAHKAGIMLGGACVGVAVTAVMAAKDRDKHIDNLEEKYEEMEKDPDDTADRDLTKKEQAIIFAKSYWRTGLSMAVTFGLMILSHRSMAKELAATAAALGVMGTKYKEITKTLKEKYPKQYDQVMKMINQKNAQRKISEKPLKKEETYDGRQRYYFPYSDQIVYMKPEDLIKVQAHISSIFGTRLEIHINEILDYIHIDLGYKDVHLCDTDYIWEFTEDDETMAVETYNFPNIELEYDDILDDDGESIVCQVVTMSFEPTIYFKGEKVS